MALLSSSLVIPQEICGLICEDPSLAQSDLYALCLVSRAFREEAERILNIYLVDLRGKRNIRAFCEKIIASRYLANSLDTLIIHMPPEGNLNKMIDTLIVAPERKSAVKSSWYIASCHLKRLRCSAKIIQALFIRM
ncbi:hypothetical protein BJ912DRAFT_150700 [Pholiota molesta]|nr:hypothetical protein BJ912DRAFT_150700 [Pholiota molesta]